MDMGKRREERLPRRKRSGEKKIGEVENITRRPVSQLLRNSERIGDTLCTRTKAKEMAKTHFGLFLLLLFWTLDKVTLLPTCHKFPQLASKLKKSQISARKGKTRNFSESSDLQSSFLQSCHYLDFNLKKHT